MATASKSNNGPREHQSAIRLAQTAKDSGVSSEALVRFMGNGYVPQPRQFAFHAAARLCDLPNGPTEIGLGGARGGAKSHAVLAQVAIDDCQRVPGIKFLLLRKVGKSMKESFEDLRQKLMRSIPHQYNRQEGKIEFANGSRIILGHFNDDADIDNYLGIEYDGIAVEEATQLSEKKYIEIQTCRRTSNPNWRPRTYTTTNPGGIGHAWYKAKFIQPWRENRESTTRFIFATFRDNRFLNHDYVHVLNDLKGWQLAAWRDGEWDIASGQFFTNWRHERHVCKRFKIPDHWRVWCSFDYGFTHPTAVYLFAEHDGVIYVVDEHVEAKRLSADHAQAIAAMLQRNGISFERLRIFVAGVDVFAAHGDTNARTIADQYAEFGIRFDRANIDRINGAAEFLNRLGNPDSSGTIRLQVFDHCRRLIECIPALQHDPHRPEDVLKIDVNENGKGGDDPYDSVRYGLMANRLPEATVSFFTERRSTTTTRPITALGAALRGTV
jgi:hypothetical protein